PDCHSLDGRFALFLHETPGVNRGFLRAREELLSRLVGRFAPLLFFGRSILGLLFGLLLCLCFLLVVLLLVGVLRKAGGERLDREAEAVLLRFDRNDHELALFAGL